MKAIAFTLLFMSLSFSQLLYAQQNVFSDSAQVLNEARIRTNQHGMKVLGTWGIANIAAGGIGYFTAKDDEWKAFHEMNAIWGVVNTGIAVMGYAGSRKELQEKLSCSKLLQRYEGTKRLYLINEGLDVLYMGTGALLWLHGDNTAHSPAMWRGFGKSLVLQGAFLFVFDNVMFASHQKRNSKWYQLLQDVCVTNNGLGLNYTF